jgi:hypothetical protein
LQAHEINPECDNVMVLKMVQVPVIGVMKQASQTATITDPPLREPRQKVALRVQHPQRHMIFVAQNGHRAALTQSMAVGSCDLLLQSPMYIKSRFGLQSGAKLDQSDTGSSKYAASAPGALVAVIPETRLASLSNLPMQGLSETTVLDIMMDGLFTRGSIDGGLREIREQQEQQSLESFTGAVLSGSPSSSVVDPIYEAEGSGNVVRVCSSSQSSHSSRRRRQRQRRKQFRVHDTMQPDDNAQASAPDDDDDDEFPTPWIPAYSSIFSLIPEQVLNGGNISVEYLPAAAHADNSTNHCPGQGPAIVSAGEIAYLSISI